MKLHLPKIRLVMLRKVIFCFLGAAVVFVGGYMVGVRALAVENAAPRVTISRILPQGKKDLDFSMFWKVWDLLSASYFDKSKLVPAKMVYGAIQGMVAAIGDPYTAYFTPDENSVVKQDLKGDLEGVGIQIGFQGTQLAVIAPLPGTPAEAAGIKPGDFIIGIKDDAKKIDHGTSGISLEEAVQEIRGPAGSKVTLSLLTDGNKEKDSKPRVVDLIRQKINVPSVILSWEGDKKNIAHIKLLKFAEDTKGEWENAVKQINDKCRVQSAECKIVLDVRNNPGGYLQEAVDIASDFLPQGTVAVIEQDGNGTKQEFKTMTKPRLATYPIDVLINKGSASASEILAGALRDQRQIKLIGEVSFGKGTIQEPEELSDGAGIHITIAKWLTPNGTWVHGKGLEPDIKVLDDEKTSEDEQLQQAIKLLGSGQ